MIRAGLHINLLNKLGCIIVLFISCQWNDKVVGEYASHKPSKFYNFWHKKDLNKGYVVGSSLSLKADSSFININCGNIMYGKWNCIGDHLFLYCDSNKYAIDSLNKSGFNGKFAECPSQPIKYLKAKDHLIGCDTLHDEQYFIINDLKKKR